jgi:hypothetical protein
MELASTFHQGARQQTVLEYVCAAHASVCKPGTQYSAYSDGTIEIRSYRPNCTVQTVGPMQ